MDEFRETLKKYCREKIEPFMEADDEKGVFRKDIYRGLGSLGLGGVTTCERYGGAGMTYGDFCLVLEEIAGTSVSYAVTLSVSTMVQFIIETFATEKQKKALLPSLARGEEIGAFSLSEFGAGSDIKALTTVAEKTRGGYLLRGSKAWVSSAGVAKIYIVMCRTKKDDPGSISAFIVEEGRQGFGLGKEEKKIGLRISPTRELIFEGLFVPEENLLGTEGEGLKIALCALDRGRVSMGAIAVGAAQRVFEESLRYSLSREQFGREIFDFQAIQFILAEMATEIEASRLLVGRAGSFFDKGSHHSGLAAMAKFKASEVCIRAATEAVQIHGAVGVTRECPVERFMRDAKVLQIVEGTSQIQKVVISRHLRQKYS